MKNFIKISVPILIFLFLTWRIGQNWQLIEDRVFSVGNVYRKQFKTDIVVKEQ